MGQLDGKVAILTGGAEGIGMSYAQALAREGARVAIWDIASADSVVEAIRRAGGVVSAHRCDVSDARSVASALAETQVAHGAPHILINNAAVFARLESIKRFEDIASSEFDLAMNVNVRGVFECCKAVSPLLRKQGYGKIVNIASGTAFKGTPGMLHYVASKGAILSMTRSLANELGADGVRCNCIAPGLVLTQAIASQEGLDAFRAGAVQGRFLKQPQTPDDLIGALIFLCAPASDFITGQTLVVDGGSALH